MVSKSIKSTQTALTPKPQSSESQSKDPKAGLRGQGFDAQSEALKPKDGGSPKETPNYGYSWATSDKDPKQTTQLRVPEDAYTHEAPRALVPYKDQRRAVVDRMAKVPNYHIILEQLAHRFAYESPDLSEADDYPGVKDKSAEQAAALKKIGFRKGKSVASSVTGFQVTSFIPFVQSNGKPVPPSELGLPDGTKLRPVLAFRGTDGGPDIGDDLNSKGIGNFQMSMHEEEVRALMADAGSAGFGLPDLTGHSLGGTLAQRAAARCPGLFNNIVTFQAPGAGDEAAKVDPKKHNSTHYMASGDLVSRAGGQHTEGNVVRMAAWGSNGPLNHCWYPLASLNEHRKEDAAEAGPNRNNTFVPGVSASIGRHNERLSPSLIEQSTRAHDSEAKSVISEGGRNLVSGHEEQAAAERLTAEVQQVVDAAVVEGVNRASVVGRVAMVLHSRPSYMSRAAKGRMVPFKPGTHAIIEKNALMRYERLTSNRR